MKVSMVIPAFNEQRLLLNSLITIEPQRHHLHECIVVDDGSNPPIKCPSWIDLHRIDRPKTHRGSSAAKNVGATIASGDYLLFTDSDFLHVPDAIESLKMSMQFYVDALGEQVLVNTVRHGIPEEDMPVPPHDIEKYLDAHRDELIDPNMTNPRIRCWEQNFSMIKRGFFWSIGGYDDVGFPSWGFNNHDLCMRVFQAGGYITSTVRRISNGKRLITTHQWHDNGVPNRDQANKEFAAKWGEPFTHDLLYRLFGKKEME